MKLLLYGDWWFLKHLDPYNVRAERALEKIWSNSLTLEIDQDQGFFSDSFKVIQLSPWQSVKVLFLFYITWPFTHHNISDRNHNQQTGLKTILGDIGKYLNYVYNF